MGFRGARVLARTADTMTLIALTDEAVDIETMARWSAEEREAIAQWKRNGRQGPKPEHEEMRGLERYRAGEDPTWKPPLKSGLAPVLFHVRPLNHRERAICQTDGEGNLSAFAYELVRWGLVKVENLEEWDDDQRERYQGATVLTRAAVSVLPDDVVAFLAMHIHQASVLPPFSRP